MLQVIPEYEGSPLDLPQFTAKAGREDASYQDVEAWILAHIPQDSFGKYHGGGTSNQVECFNSCMSRQGDKNVNRSSGHSQRRTFNAVVNKKTHGNSWVQKAKARERYGCPMTTDARKVLQRADDEAKRMSAYAKTPDAKASRAQGKKVPKGVAPQQVPLKVLKATGESAAEHGRHALKDTSQARLVLHDLRQQLRSVVEQLDSGYKLLPQKEREKNKRKREESEGELAVELSTTPMTIHMVRGRKAKMKKFTAQIEDAREAKMKKFTAQIEDGREAARGRKGKHGGS